MTKGLHPQTPSPLSGDGASPRIPGQEIEQHTHFGHAWEAHADGMPVSWFQAEADDLEWDIGP